MFMKNHTIDGRTREVVVKLVATGTFTLKLVPVVDANLVTRSLNFTFVGI